MSVEEEVRLVTRCGCERVLPGPIPANAIIVALGEYDSHLDEAYEPPSRRTFARDPFGRRDAEGRRIFREDHER